MIASAAFNDVQFTQNTTLTLGAINFTVVTGSKVASLIVNPLNFQVGLDTNSTFVITSANRQLFANTGGYTTTCGSTVSSLTINYTDLVAQTITITPGGTCSDVGIGGGGGGGGGGEPSTVTPTTAAGMGTASATSGGTATATTTENAKATVEVPAGAVTDSTTINVTPTVNANVSATASAPSGLSVVGGFVYNLTATSGGAAVTSFNKTLTLTFTYTDSQVSGFNEAALTVYRWNGTQWLALPSTVNTASNIITATTTQFSYFAVMGAASGVPAGQEEPSAIYPGIPANFTFTKTLKLGTKNTDVVYLKAILAAEGCVSGLSNTTLFASKTLAGVKCFCKKYKSDISKAAGYTVSCSGLIGAGMRAKLNALLAGTSSGQE